MQPCMHELKFIAKKFEHDNVADIRKKNKKRVTKQSTSINYT